MSAADFKPEVWVMRREGEPDRPFLVCAARWMHGDRDLPASPAGGKSFAWIAHPVAIFIGNPPAVIYGLRDDSAGWHRHGVAEFGMSTAAAQAALGDAWRGVKSETLDVRTMGYKQAIAAPSRIEGHKGGTIPRNVIAWLRWEDWNRRGFTMEQRAAELATFGRACTAKALRRAAEERGL
jgi:hypothetical protein